MGMKKRILFVDDEPNVLGGLQRMLRSMRHEWEMAFAGSGKEALVALDRESFDVVVTDMRMPGIDGAELLAEVMSRHPKTVRIILSGHSDREVIMKSIGPAHQYLSKPCDAEILKATVVRACALRDLLANETLKRLASQMQSLPSLPSLYVELMTELQSPDSSIERVGEIISQDVGMTAKILQLVNPTFFGVREHISSPAEAARLLGLDTIRALVLSVHVFSELDQIRVSGFRPDALWSHSLGVGNVSQQICRAENQERRVADESLMAGLLHDSGKLVLASNVPEQYAQALALAKRKNVTQLEAEQEIFGTTHAEVGGYLLGLWGLPDSIVGAVAFHHCPSKWLGQAFSPLTAVHVANVLQREHSDTGTEEDMLVTDYNYLSKLGLADRLPAWRELCL
jgi:HD-like signal output (HDOD) protein